MAPNRSPRVSARLALLAGTAALLVPAPAALAQSQLWSLEGENNGDELGGGQGVAPIGDQNGDGADDFLVAEPGYDGKAGGDCGRVRLFVSGKGKPTLMATFEGQNGGDRLGEFVRDVFDVDGDGDHEFAIGSRCYPAGAMQGRVDVYEGVSWKTLYTFEGESKDDEFGRVCGVGDATGDGHADLLISAIGWNRQANGHGSGRVFLYSGSDGTVYRQWDGLPGQELGYRLAALHGDWWNPSSDGKPDFCISALETGMSPQGPGRVRVHTAFYDAELDHFEGAAPGDAMAYVSDGFTGNHTSWNEFLIGQVGGGGTGLGSATLWSIGPFRGPWKTWNGTTEVPYDGEVAAAGDVDGDGERDFLLSSKSYDSEAGADVGMVQVISGGSWREMTRYVGTQPGAPLGGEAMAGACDLNGDGRTDLLTAAPSWDTTSLTDAGGAWAFAGDDLYLTITPRTAWVGDWVTIRTTAGVPNDPLIVAITRIDGIPFFLPLLVNQTFDTNGEHAVVLLDDPTYGVHDLELQAWTLKRTGRGLRSSGVVSLALR